MRRRGSLLCWRASPVPMLLALGLITLGSGATGQLITNHLALPQPALAKPSAGSAVTDPVFGTSLRRLTDATASGRPGTFPQYAKRQAWNADESLLLLTSDSGDFLLHDGSTYQFQRVIGSVAGEDVFWHPTAPHTVLYNAQNTLYAHDVLTDTETLIYAFTNYYANTSGEGNLSRDGRYYAVYARDYDESSGAITPRALLLVDLATTQEVSRLALPPTLASFDWVSVSPLGNHVVVDYATTATGPFEGVEVYDRQFNLVWQKPLGAGHSDMGIDSAGEEILVMVVYDDVSNVNVTRKYRLSDGQETDLVTVPWNFDQHISCRNAMRSEWCFISTFDAEGRLTDDSLSWLPFEDEIFAVKLDGSGQVQRLAHHRSRRFSPSTPDPDQSVYWAEPHATVSRKGDRVLFGSNWREGMGVVTNVDAYVTDFRAFVSLWSGASDAGNGWKWLAWFGYFKDQGNGWIWHAEHGWVYYGAAGTTSSLWLWNSRMGWLWTQDSLYPFLWLGSLHTWLWYYRSTGNGAGGWFYNFLTGHTEWR